MAYQAIKQIEDDLWSAADQLRANSRLTASEYSMPVLGLIVLRHATTRFNALLPNQRDATTVHQQMALAAIFPLRSVGLGPTLCCASGAFIIAPSMLCHRQAMPSNASYPASPDFHSASKPPRFLPLQKVGMDCAGTAVARVFRQRTDAWVR